MTEKKLYRWLRNNGLADLWWVSVAGDVADEPRRLDEVARIQSSTTEPVSVLHVSQAGSKDPPWVAVEHPTPSRRRRRSKGSRLLLIVSLTVLLATLIGGAYFVGTSGGVASLFSAEGSVAYPVERRPSLRVRVGRSDWMLFVYNGNLSAWEGMQVQLITGDQVWTYDWAEPLNPEQTLQIPFRDFDSDHGRLDIRSEPPERIRLIVPGYAEFEERMR